MQCSWPLGALAAILTVLTLFACGGTSWTKAEGTQEELERDRSICVRYARRVGEAEAARIGLERPSQRATAATLRRCMQARGWLEDTEAG